MAYLKQLIGLFTGAFQAFDKDGDGLIKLNVVEVRSLYSLLV